MPAIDIPPEMPLLAGLFVGGCVARGDGSSFRARAHAHTATTDSWIGWVCVRAARRVLTPSGRPSTLMWHEYAHIVAGPSHGHDATWRSILTAFGHPAEAKRYIKKKRPPLVWFWHDDDGMLQKGTYREFNAAVKQLLERELRAS